jgi:nucleotide-binding universal stress UspA family protein
MFKTILVPTDGSPSADKAALAAVKFAKEIGGKIIGISVAEPHPSALLSDSDFFGSAHGFQDKAHDLAKGHVETIAAAARAANVPCETVAVHSVRPDEEILNAAKKYNCDLIFMASHGRKGWTGLFVGSETQKVLAHSTIPVLVFRETGDRNIGATQATGGMP